MERPVPSTDLAGVGARGELTTHEQKIIDYVLQAVDTNSRVRTEEVIVRNRSTVASEINQAFSEYTKISTMRKVGMAVAGIAAFGLGFLVKGWVTSHPEETEANGVHE